MRFSIFWIKLCCLVMLAAAATFAGLTPVKTLQIKSDIISSDNLGNLYAIEGNTIRKYTRNGELYAEYTNTRIDKFNSLDASNPLKILLFSKSSAEIIRLDNKLAQQGSTSVLYHADLVSPAMTCNSYDNGVWIWDNALNEIVRLNQNAAIDYRTGNLINITGDNPEIKMIREKDFLLYVAAPSHGLLIFDRHANYVRSVPLKDINLFQLGNNRIIYMNNGKLKSYNMKTFQETSLDLPVKSCINAIVEGKHMFIQHTDSISIFVSNTML